MADSIQDIIDQAARQYGVDPVALKAVAFLESKFDPSAKNPRSSAGGLFQQIDSNAKAYGVKNRIDPRQSALGAARFMADNKRTLIRVLGREPNVGELYLAHQQGPGGASKLLRNPNAKAVDVVGAQAVKLNGGNANMSASEFASLWTNKAERAAVRVSNGDYTAQLNTAGDMSGGGGSDAMMGGEGDDTVLTRDPGAIERTYKAFVDGEMSPQERAAYEADVRSGRMPIPTGMSIGEPINVEVAQIDDAYNRYQSGDMPDDQKAEYEADVRAGVMPLPNGVAVQFGQIAPVVQPEDTMQPDTPAGPEDERGFFDETGRQLGLTGRYLAQGAAGLAGVVTDPMDYLIAQALGTEQPAPLRQRVSDALTAQGVPQPETGMERIIGQGSEAMVGAGASVKAAQGVGALLSPGVGQASAQMAAAAPAAQVGGGLGAGVGQQATAEAGGGPVAQTAAALLGGVAGSGVGSALTTPDMPMTPPRASPEPTAPAPRPDITPDIPAPRVLGEGETNEMRALIARAASNNATARKRLAEMAKVDPEALDAAQRLGIDVPADVFATNSAVQQASGIVRAVRGSDAAAEWEDAFTAAQQRANDVIEGEGGTLDLAAVADRVQTTLTNSIDDLRAKGSAVFDSIKQDIPQGARVQPNASTKAVADIITELGGEESLPTQVRSLFKAVTSDQGMTYGRLMQERAQIGKALAKSQGPYADADSYTLNKLYGALADDQLNFVQAQLGDAAAERLKNGNALWSSAKDLEGKLVAGFGKDQQGSIANTLRTSLTNASKGDAGRLNRILDVIPKGLQREAVLTALADMSQAKSGQGSFSFPNYAKLYRGLRQNSPIYKRLADVLGKDTSDLMRDLYEVSIRVDRAAQNVPRTGMSNQALIADGLMSNVLNSSVGKAARGTAAGMAGSAIGGPLLGSLAAVGASSGNLGKNRAQLVGQLFKSAEFQKLAIEAARAGMPSGRDIARAAKSPAFMRWSKAVGIKDPQGWLIGALTPQQAVEIQQIQQEQSNGN